MVLFDALKVVLANIPKLLELFLESFVLLFQFSKLLLLVARQPLGFFPEAGELVLHHLCFLADRLAEGFPILLELLGSHLKALTRTVSPSPPVAHPTDRHGQAQNTEHYIL